MPTYVSLLNWTEQGIKHYRDTTDRAHDFTNLVAIIRNVKPAPDAVNSPALGLENLDILPSNTRMVFSRIQNHNQFDPAGFSFSFSGISWGGHVGGLIGGILATLAFARWGRGHAAYGRLGLGGVLGLVAIAVGSVAVAYLKVRGLAA